MKNDDTLNALNKQLDTLASEEQQLKKKETRLYKLMLNEALEDDKKLIDDHTSAKKKVSTVALKIKNLQSKIESEKNNDRLGNLNKLVDSFSVENNFKAIQIQLRGFVENIYVLYNVAGGFCTVLVDFKDLGTSSLFLTDKKAL